jgi:bacterioferritin (cytochrome b1)
MSPEQARGKPVDRRTEKDEEESIDWLESQLHLVKEVGRERYLAEQIHR